MGYQVYWANGRWQGYGVPAYCDYPGCKEEIDRGIGYKHQDDDESPPLVFCCTKHKYQDLPDYFEPEEKENPEWINHLLTDDSWEEWRIENPEIVEKYKSLCKE